MMTIDIPGRVCKVCGSTRWYVSTTLYKGRKVPYYACRPCKNKRTMKYNHSLRNYHVLITWEMMLGDEFSAWKWYLYRGSKPYNSTRKALTKTWWRNAIDNLTDYYVRDLLKKILGRDPTQDQIEKYRTYLKTRRKLYGNKKENVPAAIAGN